VRHRELQPLAARPITLDLLLSEATLGLELLPDISPLCERGCRRVLSERPESIRFTQPQATDADQKLAIAAGLLA
jgi:hypothetical protein